jgi:RNA recognition motif-containing protein
MYSRGRKVNREFAFISYNTPAEAQHAVQCLHGLQVPDLQKDATGITVEYENGECLL